MTVLSLNITHMLHTQTTAKVCLLRLRAVQGQIIRATTVLGHVKDAGITKST